MRFVETPVFTREVLSLLPEEDYRALQVAPTFHPDQGAVISGAGGLRKLRGGGSRRGKRGGIRIIYSWAEGQDTICMLFAYAKSDHEKLTPSQLRVLARLVREEFK